MRKQDLEYRARKTLNATRGALRGLDSSMARVKRAAKIIAQRNGNIVITAIGKSGFIAMKIAATLTSLGHRALFLHPVEAIHGDIGALSQGDVLLALSFSGETGEVVKITKYAKNHFKVPVVAFTKSKKSSLGKLADYCVEIKIASEGSPGELAPMASTTAMLVLGDMLAAMLTEESFKKDHFARFHPGGSLGLKLKKVTDYMKTDEYVPLVASSAPFIDVVREMDDKKLGATGVIDVKGKLVGVITDGDLRRFLLDNQDSADIRARDIMTKNPKYVREADSLDLAITQMEKYKITHLFVITSLSKPTGIIHIHDILEKTFI